MVGTSEITDILESCTVHANQFVRVHFVTAELAYKRLKVNVLRLFITNLHAFSNNQGPPSMER
jgi:hypothetical protein